MSTTATATTAAATTTTYSLTTPLAFISAVNPSRVATFATYTYNIEIDSKLQGNPAPGLPAAQIFLANLSGGDLGAMMTLAAAALAVGDEVSLHYKFVVAPEPLTGADEMVAVITSLAYKGKRVSV